MNKIKPSYKLANAVRTKLLLFIDSEIQTQKQSKNKKDINLRQEHINADSYKITFDEEFSEKKIINYFYDFPVSIKNTATFFVPNNYINKNKSPETCDATPGKSKFINISELQTSKKVHRSKTIPKEILDVIHKKERKLTDVLTEKEQKIKPEKKGSGYLKELSSNLKSAKNLFTKSNKKHRKSLFISKMNSIKVKNNLKNKDENIISLNLRIASKKNTSKNYKKTNSNSIIKLIRCK